MFEQTFIDGSGRGVRPWTLAVSLALQCSLLAAAVLAPLVFTYELPVTEWLEHTILAPPPAPAAAAPAAATTAPKPQPPTRFDAMIAPATIPNNVTLLRDAESLADGLAAPEIGAMRGGIAGGVEGGVLGVAAAIFVPQMPIRLGGRVQAAKILNRVSPVYPAEAVEQGLTGVVHLEAIITVEGAVRDIKVLSGEPALARAAVDAVRQWRYQPTFLNGRPVEVITDIKVNFAIHAPPEKPEQGKRNRGKKR
ncbi:MAG: energy transducer TonB [Bryobacterales bacterium]